MPRRRRDITDCTPRRRRDPAADDPEGGGFLSFPELDPPVRIRPRAGDGVVWNNLDAKGEPSRLALHAGLPLVGGALRLRVAP